MDEITQTESNEVVKAAAKINKPTTNLCSCQPTDNDDRTWPHSGCTGSSAWSGLVYESRTCDRTD